MAKLREEDKAMVLSNYRLVDEVFYEMRKGLAQSYYVIEVLAGEEWDGNIQEFCPISDHLVGFWRTAHADDLSYMHAARAIKDFDWVRCEKATITTYDWQVLASDVGRSAPLTLTLGEVKQ
jgi:hypothetical protein